MIVSTIVPNNYFMSFEVVQCWLKLFALKKYQFVYTQGPDLDFNRNRVWAQAMARMDHLLMIDSDIVFSIADVEKMENYLNQGYDAVTGVYPVGRSPYPPCIFERIPGDYKLTLPPIGFSTIDACGGGFLGVSKKVLLSMPNDPFDNITEGTIFHGEDISFCHRLKENNFKLWCDSDLKVGHLRTHVFY